MEKTYPKRKINRLQGFDYNSDGYYFITTCVQNKIQCLSQIDDADVKLTKYGNIVMKYLDIFKTRYPHVTLKEHVLMPNHVHIILYRKTTPSNISIIQYVSALKTLTCRDIRKTGFTDFQWQKSYYDRIIRSDLEYYNIANYIDNNHIKWTNDIENPELNYSGKESEYYEAIFEEKQMDIEI